MKSVGEVMAIGRTFEEALQKGLRMIGQGMHGLVGNKDLVIENCEKELAEPTDMRIFVIAMALKNDYSIEKIHELTKIDKWFLEKLKNIYTMRNQIYEYNTLEELPLPLLIRAKQLGFSDFQIARLILKSQDTTMEDDIMKVRKYRLANGIKPVVKQIDTLAAEYPAQTNYLYLTYCGDENDIEINKEKKSVIVLGSGAYRIGSSVEFDWCSVNALTTIQKQGYSSVMINYNPETVSTDYDISDRLYFDELTFERVMDIIDLESPDGVIVSVGGQIPNTLAMRLNKVNVNILGTLPKSIDRAEDRHKFSEMLDNLNIDQPDWIESTTLDEAIKFVDKVGYPLLIRPSYVLSGAAMNVVSNQSELEKFLTMAANVSKQYPVVVTKFYENTKEIEMDAVAQKGEIIAYAISEHVEFAGVHSGDATMLFPPQKIYVETVRRIKKITSKIAKELNITGPFNIQFLAKDNDIKVIECNLRSSRSFPFVSKVLKTNFIELATKAMLGIKITKPDKSLFDLDYIGVKAPQFSFSRLHKADPVLGVEMASTGEVGCLGENYYEAILSAMLSVGYEVPEKNILLSTGSLRSKVELVNSAKMLIDNNYKIFSTLGTYEFLNNEGIKSTLVPRPADIYKPDVIDLIKEKKFDLIINISKDLSEEELERNYKVRRHAVDYNIPLITNARLASAFIYAFCKMKKEDISIKSWNEM